MARRGLEELEIPKCQDLVDEDFTESEMDDLFAGGREEVRRCVSGGGGI